MMLKPKTLKYRQKAEDHPLVRATLEAERRIRRDYPWKGDWLLAINLEVATLGLVHGRRFAESVGYGLRSRMKLLNESWCVQVASGGCQCAKYLNHDGRHRCCCGREFTQAQAYHGRRGRRKVKSP
jgi:hypothetical protein